MITVAVIDDELEHLVKIGTHFLLYPSNEIQVKLYLATVDSNPLTEGDDEDIAGLQKEIARYHPNKQLPPIQPLPVIEFADEDQCRSTLAKLAADKIDLIVCDSQIRKDNLAG